MTSIDRPTIWHPRNGDTVKCRRCPKNALPNMPLCPSCAMPSEMAATLVSVSELYEIANMDTQRLKATIEGLEQQVAELQADLRAAIEAQFWNKFWRPGFALILVVGSIWLTALFHSG